MACGTINPAHCKTGAVGTNAKILPDGTIFESGEKESRDFMTLITEADEDEQQKIVDVIYDQTQRIVFLVRARLEEEKSLNIYYEETEE